MSPVSYGCVTKRNMIASNALLAVDLKMKLAAIPMVYTEDRLEPISTPKTLSEMKNKTTKAKNSRILSRVFKAEPTSRMERDKKRRSL